MIHIAVLKPGYIELILEGTKTIESRLLKTRSAPYGRVARGQMVYFKASGGGYSAIARVDGVEQHEALTSGAIERLRRRHNNRICAPREFWSARRDARYGVFISLSDVRAIERGPRIDPLYGRAWLCLPSSRAPRSVRSAA
jgi:ASC-1-like (ASCH) protein